jgi:5'-nucleotidase
MKRRKFILKGLAASAMMAGAPMFLGSCQSQLKGKKLVVLHTNDMHSHIDPFTEGRNKGFGGMGARASAIAQVRAQEPNVLLLDVGDVFQGTPYFNMFGGELELKLMSQMGYDATTIGNHEFDNGLDGLKKAVQYAEFPYLSANYDFSKNQMANEVKPYQIFIKDGIRVGVFGLGIKLEGLVNSTMYGNTVYEDPIAVAKEMVAELKSKQCDLIICLSHLGYDYGEAPYPSDIRLANEVSEIDLILGGHTHTFMDEPYLLTNDQGFTTTINQVGWAGINLGRIDILFDANQKAMASSELIKLEALA